MPTGMSLPSFGSATSRGYRGVSQADYGLKLNLFVSSADLIPVVSSILDGRFASPGAHITRYGLQE